MVEHNGAPVELIELGKKEAVLKLKFPNNLIDLTKEKGQYKFRVKHGENSGKGAPDIEKCVCGVRGNGNAGFDSCRIRNA
jgi:hypothetical protein